MKNLIVEWLDSKQKYKSKKFVYTTKLRDMIIGKDEGRKEV